MKSPRFALREKEVRTIFTTTRIKRAWKDKVRAKMRNHLLPDPIEHLDFHLGLDAHCSQIAKSVCDGVYRPGPAHRVLMEKSKGLCRQIVIPNIADALVLQCLSDSLYQDIKGKAPSDRAFFEPEDHTFSATRKSIVASPKYGAFRAWLNFQKSLFKFTENHDYVVVTDISNYYDFISYTHLRNVIADRIEVRESVLDMLIFILSGLLWQPDYAPRIEVGLPQMDIDAPRILAHCFLYELDSFLEDQNVDYARFMDDIDIGVDSVNEARCYLRDIDLVLQVRQVRLNSGKTIILRSREAERHFRVRENMLLDRVVARLDRKIANRISIDRERNTIRRALHSYYKKGRFDDGNGEKVLTRLLNLSRRIDAKVENWLVNDVLRRRPALRSTGFGVIEWQGLTPRSVKLVVDFLTSGTVIDEFSLIDGANALVHAMARSKPYAESEVRRLVRFLSGKGFFGVYAAIWLMSKYEQSSVLHEYLADRRDAWRNDLWLGRMVGGMAAILLGTREEGEFQALVRSSRNKGTEEVMEFHKLLRSDIKAVAGVQKIVMAPNVSKQIKITHAKFLVLLSILANEDLSEQQKGRYIRQHSNAWKDAFYRRRARSIVKSAMLKSMIV